MLDGGCDEYGELLFVGISEPDRSLLTVMLSQAVAVACGRRRMGLGKLSMSWLSRTEKAEAIDKCPNAQR
jgi:hypothetical protein